VFSTLATSAVRSTRRQAAPPPFPSFLPSLTLPSSWLPRPPCDRERAARGRSMELCPPRGGSMGEAQIQRRGGLLHHGASSSISTAAARWRSPPWRASPPRQRYGGLSRWRIHGAAVLLAVDPWG
jgi:hypothetical protein